MHILLLFILFIILLFLGFGLIAATLSDPGMFISAVIFLGLIYAYSQHRKAEAARRYAEGQRIAYWMRSERKNHQTDLEISNRRVFFFSDESGTYVTIPSLGLEYKKVRQL
jgi:hypothetical protein